MKPFVALLVLATSLANPPASAQTQSRAAGDVFAERFRLFDRDEEGRLSREEGGSLPFSDALTRRTGARMAF